MDTSKLRYFVTVAESGSLTKASQILGISHSGLSKAISVLESEANLTLFRPLGRGLEITPEGKWFYKKAQDILRISDEMIGGHKVERSWIRIGVSGVIAVSCSGLLAAAIDAPVCLEETDLGELEGKIVADELDFGIAFIPSPKPELEYLEIGEVRFNSYAREDLWRAQDITKLPYVVPISDFPFNPLGYKNRDGWPKDVPRTPYFSVSGFAIALELVRAGRAAAYMPDFVATRENDRLNHKTKIISVAEHAHAESRRTAFLVKRQSSTESKAMKKAAKVVRQICCIKR